MKINNKDGGYGFLLATYLCCVLLGFGIGGTVENSINISERKSIQDESYQAGYNARKEDDRLVREIIYADGRAAGYNKGRKDFIDQTWVINCCDYGCKDSVYFSPLSSMSYFQLDTIGVDSFGIPDGVKVGQLKWVWE